MRIHHFTPLVFTLSINYLIFFLQNAVFPILKKERFFFVLPTQFPFLHLSNCHNPLISLPSTVRQAPTFLHLLGLLTTKMFHQGKNHVQEGGQFEKRKNRTSESSPSSLPEHSFRTKNGDL